MRDAILPESKNYILGHSYEQVILINKSCGIKTKIGHHYGDPVTGLIGQDESWFVTAGEGVLYFDFKRGSRSFLRQGFRDTQGKAATFLVPAIRLESPTRVGILLDPWSEYASVWMLDIESPEIEKVQDGPSLIDQLYQEEVPF